MDQDKSIYILVEEQEVQDHRRCELERLLGQDEISARPKRATTPRNSPAPRNSHMHVVHGACRSALHTSCQNVTSTPHHSNKLQLQLQRTHTFAVAFSPRRDFELV